MVHQLLNSAAQEQRVNEVIAAYLKESGTPVPDLHSGLATRAAADKASDLADGSEPAESVVFKLAALGIFTASSWDWTQGDKNVVLIVRVAGRPAVAIRDG